MFSENDEKYLIRQLGRNEVILFLGSGFSRNAKNCLGEKFPTGWALGNKLWDFLGYEGEYDGTPLPEMYQAFLNAGKKRSVKTNFLNDNLLSDEVPEMYDVACIPYWYKVYSLNIDDIIDVVYKRNSKIVQNLVYPHDEFGERDQSLERAQVVYLHGKLPCDPEDVIFSTKQYAKATNKNQPLYSQFIFDYATHPTIFIGTDLNEPLFESYIEAREGKGGYAELRPKSYIITPSLSPVKKDNFKSEYNVHHIKGTTDEFLTWLLKISSQLPERKEILKTTFPNLLNLIDFADLSNVRQRHVKAFADTFKRVPTEYKVKNVRSGFLQGTNPTWNDIFLDLDIPRELTSELLDEIKDFAIGEKKSDKQLLYSIDGYAGAGKSTIIKRLGLSLSQNGVTVFISDSDFVARYECIVDVLMAIDEQVVLIFDNAKNIVPQLDRMIQAFSALDNPPIVVLALRSNQMDRLKYVVDPEIVNHYHYQIKDLYDQEIYNLIAKLEECNLLGRLKGMNSNQRFREFKYRSKKQILIAMMEATKGKSFNEIIHDEFDEISPYEAKMLCLCIALNTELGFTNSKQDLIGFSEAKHSEALNYLKTNLNGIVLWVNGDSKFMLRHRILADFIIKKCASLNMLKSAYIRVLSVLSPELKKSQGNSRKFNLYKSLINHKILYRRFRENIELAREVFDSLTSYFNDDAHFWLQYGSLELEGKGGDLSLADNYINQAESLAPRYTYIQNAKCLLYYRYSTAVMNYAQALDYKQKANELSQSLLTKVGAEDPHIAHIHCKGEYEFIRKWITDPTEKKQKVKELRDLIEKAVMQHPRDRKLYLTCESINRAYLQLGSSVKMADPDIPD